MANVKNNASAKETKRRLIEAAGEVFAAHGFERATIKEITDRAGASVAAVNYHFSDKQELYDAVVQHVHTVGCQVMESLTAEADGAMPAEERLHSFISHLLRHVLDPSLPDWYGHIKAREMQNPTAATERFISGSICTFNAQLGKLILELLGASCGKQDLIWLTNSVVSQCLYYAHNRELLRRLYPDLLPAADTVPALADHITRFSLAALSCWKKTTARQAV